MDGNITEKQYGELSRAYEFFNKRLWDGKLPPCMIVLGGRPKIGGYYCPKKYAPRGAEDTSGCLAELCMNPLHFDRPVKETLGTLVHEMAHCWQQELATPPRAGYHNREWGKEMERVGLMPSATGAPDGPKTGQRMSHYIIEGGLFDRLADEFIQEFAIEWKSLPALKKKRPKSKLKYVCPQCQQKAWAKPDAELACGRCKMDLSCAEDEDDED